MFHSRQIYYFHCKISDPPKQFQLEFRFQTRRILITREKNLHFIFQ
jgi:hypothetical protein